MKITAFTGIALLLTVASSWAQDNSSAAPASARPSATTPAMRATVKRTVVDLSTPEKTLLSFFDALGNYDFKAMTTCLFEGDYTPEMQAFEKEIQFGKMRPESFRIALISSRVETVDEDTVVYCSFRFTERTTYLPEVKTSIGFVREGSDWKINAAYMGNYFFSQVKESAQENASLDNMRRLAAACLAYRKDHKQVFSFPAPTFKKVILPYVRDETVFTSPLDRKGKLSYHFNPKLIGKSVSQIADPARTVMLYEGGWHDPQFRYHGRAVVGYLDGHCAFVTGRELLFAVWEIGPRFL